MPQDLSANFQDSGLDYSLPPPPNADFSDDVNIFPAGPDSSTSGVTTSSSAPVRTPRSTSATSVARQGLKGLDDTSMEPPARIWRDGDDSLDLSSRGSRRPDAILGSISTNTPVVKLRGSKKNAPMTLREHEKTSEAATKEIFQLKMHIHFLEEQRLSAGSDNIDLVMKQNIELKMRFQQLDAEHSTLKKENKALHSSITRLSDTIQELEVDKEELRQRVTIRNASTNDIHDQLEDMEQQNYTLRENLVLAQQQLQDSVNEIERLRERRHSASISARMEDLEHTIERLKEAEADTNRRLTDADEELDKYHDALESEKRHTAQLEVQVERLQFEQKRASQERSHSRAEMLDDLEDREALESDRDRLRDQVAALTITDEQKEEIIEQQSADLQAMHDDLAKSQRGNFAIAERNKLLEEALEKSNEEITRLVARVDELETNLGTMHDSFETACEHLEKEKEDLQLRIQALEEDLQARDTDVANANKDVDQLGQRVFDLEEDLEHVRARAEQEIGEAIDRAQLHEEMCDSLKEKLVTLRSEHTHVQDNFDDLQKRYHDKENRVEELRHAADDARRSLESEHSARLKADREMREFATKLLDTQDEVKALKREMGDLERTSAAELAEKDSALQQLRTKLKSAQSLLEQRETDIAQIQSALQSLENEKRKLGESHTTDRFSLSIEVDRLKRDLARCQNELDLAREEVKMNERTRREREGILDKLHDENRELTTQLSSQTQARLNLGEKLDAAQASVKQVEADLQAAKHRVSDLEQRLNRDQRAILASENSYRDQLTERNTLLLTIYQYMEKILGPETGLKTGSAAETKPYTNFSVFHDNLVSRLKAISQIQLDFDRRVKSVEAGFTDKIGELSKQLERRWKQIDKFEASVQKLSQDKTAWRKKINLKDGELEAVKTSNSELTTQLTALRRATAIPASPSSEVRGLNQRIRNLEHRIAQAQNQNGALEERLAKQDDEKSRAASKLEVRMQEYDRLLKEANEKYKREKQGAKERVSELEATIKSLQNQIELTNRRTLQIQDVASSAKPGR